MTTQAFPDLSTTYALPQSAIDSYAAKGHCYLPAVIAPDEVAPCRDLITTATMSLNQQTVPLAERGTYGKAFLQVGNLFTRRPETRAYILARRFAGIAAKLMGVPAVRLYHDQALYKEGGGGHTPWHQDQFYWPLDTNHTITMWMPLVDANEDMGVLRFASGSHQEGYLGARPISDDSEAHFDAYVKEKGFTVEGPKSMRAGDATFHSGWTLHSAPGNFSATMREVMTVIYYADGVKVIDPIDNANRAQDLAVWLPGCVPGGPAVSHMNPLLYP